MSDEAVWFSRVLGVLCSEGNRSIGLVSGRLDIEGLEMITVLSHGLIEWRILENFSNLPSWPGAGGY